MHHSMAHTVRNHFRAQIVKENEPQPIVLDLFDNGSGSDLVANDGIYSRYFTRYNGDGRYSLKCQITGDQNTGFIVQKQGTKIFGTRTYPSKPTISSPICCGSSSGSNLKIQSTGNFTRKATGISFKVGFILHIFEKQKCVCTSYLLTIPIF